MGRRRTRLQPLVEGFETRALLSSGVTGPSSVAAVVGASGRYLHLDGTFHGKYVIVSAIPDAGATYSARGSGHLHGVGRAHLKATFRSVGFIEQGVAQGDITLKRRGGTISLHLTGPDLGGGPAGLPGVFSAGITAATGKFRGDHGIGSATLTLVPGQASVGIEAGQSGTYTLVFSPRPLPL